MPTHIWRDRELMTTWCGARAEHANLDDKRMCLRCKAACQHIRGAWWTVWYWTA